MGQIIAKLGEKYLTDNRSATKLESTGMLHDVSLLDESSASGLADEPDLDFSAINPRTAALASDNSQMHTPPNVVKIKCDPRSPGEFNRTPLQIPVTNGRRK